MAHQVLTFRFVDDDVLLAPPTCGPVVVPDLLRLVQQRCVRRRGSPRLVLDLGEVVEWDMSVLSTAVWARRRCIAARGDLAIVLPREPVFTEHEVVCLEQLFHVAQDVEGARAALCSSASHRYASRSLHEVV